MGIEIILRPGISAAYRIPLNRRKIALLTPPHRIPTMAKTRPADTAAQLSAILWGALGYLAKKRSKKSLLTVGDSTKVDVLIEGKIGRKAISERVTGSLKLNADSSRASTQAADPDQVIALILARFPDAETRERVIADLVAAKESKKGLPAATAEQLDHAKQFLTRLRSSTTTKVSGALVFSLLPPTAKPAPKPASK